VAFIFFEKPAARKRIPTNRQYAAAARFDFPPNPALVDKVKRHANSDRGQSSDKNNAQIQ
jgi:hypothetical protein